jgi:uncharacterized HAD superfamily protein
MSKERCYPKTFFIDIDGTIVHNLSWEELELHSKIPDFVQELLPGVKEFFTNLNEKDIIIFTTGRGSEYRDMTERTLHHNNIKFHCLMMDLPIGQRFLINDTVNIFFKKSIAINVLRNVGFGDTFIFDPEH